MTPVHDRLPEERPARFCVGIVASSGGLDALSRVLGPLPADFPAAIAIVLHLEPGRASRLAQILDRRTALRVREAGGGEVLAAGVVLVAPPNRHLEVGEGGAARLTDAPKERFSRPSGNPLFLSLARRYRERAVAVVLTGLADDGAAGLLAVGLAGGATLAQDEATSREFSMPRAAIETGGVEAVLDVDRIAAYLVSLVALRSSP